MKMHQPNQLDRLNERFFPVSLVSPVSLLYYPNSISSSAQEPEAICAKKAIWILPSILNLNEI